MQPDSYAILRFGKLKSMSQIRAMGQHWFRTAPTDNADPQRRTLNRLLVGSEDPAADVQALLPAKRRKDAVIAMECFLGASPEYFRPDDPARYGKFDPAKADQWIDRTMTWLHSQYGDRLVSAVFHADEATPHIQAVVVPLGAKGNLCANTMFNPRSLQNLQSSYAKALEPLGIKRGIAGSKARHQEVDKHYTAVNASQSDIELTVKDRAALAAGRTPQKIKDLQAKAGDHENAQKQALQAQEAAAVISRTNDEAKAALRAVQARLRGIPIAEVLPRLGYEPDPDDKVEGWKGPAGRLTTGVRRGTPEKFYLHDMNVGGGGAIDLVMRVDNRDFRDAVAWLSAQFGEGPAIATYAAVAETAAKEAIAEHKQAGKSAPLIELSRKPDHIAAVSHYLTGERRIPAEMVKALSDKGFILALQSGRFTNAAFPLTKGSSFGDPTKAVGVLLRGTQPDHPFHGVRGEKAVWGYTSPWAKDGKRDAVIFAESPTDVMSVHSLMLRKSGLLGDLESDKIRTLFCTATAGSARESLRPLVQSHVEQKRVVFTAFDNDHTGRQMSAFVKQVANESSPDATVVNLSDLLVLLANNLKDFNDLWHKFLEEGAEKLKKRLAEAREARAERQRQELRERSRGGIGGRG